MSAAALTGGSNFRTPGSRLVLRADATREEWLAERLKGIGGSDVSKLLGLSNYGSAYGVWLEKTGRKIDERKASEAMYWGTALEPALRARFIEDTGLRVRSAGLHRSKEFPWMQVTVDGLTSDGGIFESKTGNSWAAGDQWDDDGVPDHAALQVAHGMAVTGRSHGWVVGLLDGQNWQVRRVERDEALIEIVVEAERRFWHDHVLADVEPPVEAGSLDEVKERYREVDPDSELLLELADWQVLELTLNTRKEAFKAAELAVKETEAQIRNRVGAYESVRLPGQDKPIATLKPTANMSLSKLKEDKPDVVEQYTEARPVFNLQRFKLEQPELYTAYRSRVLRIATRKPTK